MAQLPILFNRHSGLKFFQHLLRRLSSQNEKKSGSDNTKFSEEETTKIITALNQETNGTLHKLNIPQSFVEKFELWKNKNGNFHSLSDVLDVEGVDIKNLIKVCRSVASDKPIKVTTKSINSKGRQIVSPGVSPQLKNHLSSSVAIHLSTAGISWSRLSCPSTCLDVWDYRDFSKLPSKASSNENFELALDLLENIPVGDVYVLEGLPGVGLQGQAQLGAIMAHLQQVELSSMLLALLNTSENHNRFLRGETRKVENVVYMLKTTLPAKLFQTWVGTEKVSAIATVQQFFDETDFNLPCSPVEVKESTKNKFEKYSSIYKELMSQSLLLNVTFLNLCIYKNPTSLEAISLLGKRR